MTPVATQLLSWKASWSVGVAHIDVQHMNLISLVNQLNDAMRAGRGKDVLGDILTKLVNYTKMHFSVEEQMLQTQGYPGLAPHKLEHQKLTETVLQFQREFHSGTTTLSVEVMQFLSDWLKNHILGSDMEYGKYLKAKAGR